MQLRFETVLADSDRLLRETGLPPDVAVELWILRSQAHVRRLPDLIERVEALEARLAELEGGP